MHETYTREPCECTGATAGDSHYRCDGCGQVMH
jgi:hypothetical protein